MVRGKPWPPPLSKASLKSFCACLRSPAAIACCPSRTSVIHDGEGASALGGGVGTPASAATGSAFTLADALALPAGGGLVSGSAICVHAAKATPPATATPPPIITTRRSGLDGRGAGGEASPGSRGSVETKPSLDGRGDAGPGVGSGVAATPCDDGAEVLGGGGSV